MGIRVALHHKTVYQYDRPVTLSPQVVRLRPAPHSRTPVHSYSLRIEPAEPLHQLAAGSAGQLPGPAGVPVRDDGVLARSGPGGRDDGGEPVRLLPGAERRAGAVRLRRAAARRAGAVPPRRTAGPAPRRAAGLDSAHAHAHRRVPGRPEPAHPVRGPLPDSDGAGRADERGHARHRQRLLPRLRLAAGGNAAAPGHGRPLRVRLSDPAGARSEAARRPCRPAAGLHRSPRLGRGLPAGRRLGGPRSRPRGSSRARDTFRWRQRRTRSRRRRSRAW